MLSFFVLVKYQNIQYNILLFLFYLSVAFNFRFQFILSKNKKIEMVDPSGQKVII